MALVGLWQRSRPVPKPLMACLISTTGASPRALISGANGRHHHGSTSSSGSMHQRTLVRSRARAVVAFGLEVPGGNDCNNKGACNGTRDVDIHGTRTATVTESQRERAVETPPRQDRLLADHKAARSARGTPCARPHGRATSSCFRRRLASSDEASFLDERPRVQIRTDAQCHLFRLLDTEKSITRFARR